MKYNFAKFVLKRDKINKLIKKQAKIDNSIIYGSRAMNKHLHPFARRYASDTDIYTNTPKRDAKKMEKKLDNELKGDYFYTKPAQSYGTTKLMNYGLLRHNPRDDIAVADYTFGTTPNVKIKGNRYEKLSKVIKEKKRMIREKETKFRNDKDKADLRRIKLSKAYKRSKVGM